MSSSQEMGEAGLKGCLADIEFPLSMALPPLDPKSYMYAGSTSGSDMHGSILPCIAKVLS